MRVLVLGEHGRNDGESVATLLKGLSTKVQVANGRQIPRPLRHDLGPGGRRPQAGEIKARSKRILDHALKAAGRECDLVLLIEDFDGQDVRDPASNRWQSHVRADQYDAATNASHSLVSTSNHCPAWDLEAWLLLFPEAIRATRKAWASAPVPPSGNTGQMGCTKDLLKAKTKPTYAPSDALDIAKKVVTLGYPRPRSGAGSGQPRLTNASWERFESWATTL